MRLYPQDLGPRWYAALLRQRQGARKPENAADDAALTPSPPPGWLERAVRGAVDLEPRDHQVGVAASTAPLKVASLALGGGGWFMGSMLVLAMLGEGNLPAAAAGVMLPLFTIASAGFGLQMARWQFKWLHVPLRPSDLDGLRAGTSDPLEQAFFETVRAATTVRASPEATENVRAAIRSLGEALERLPRVEMKELDTDALREQAAALMAEAQAEPDRVTAESCERRAQAVLQRADTNDRSALLARRSAALRDELLAQVEALREGLAAMQLNSPDLATLEAVSGAARKVALEAGSVAEARHELESSLHSGAVGVVNAEEREVRIRSGAS